MGDPALLVELDAIARALERADHRQVLRHHIGLEHLDTAFTRGRGEMFEEQPAQAHALVRVFHCEGDIGAVGGSLVADVVGDADHVVPIAVDKQSVERLTATSAVARPSAGATSLRT